MTNYPADNGGYLVEVQAQVMTRDQSTQCWVPMGGGGLSIVKLCKLVPPHHSSSSPPNTPPPKAEYLIRGERLADKSVVLDCVLTKDIQYTKANPKFHHWNSDDKRFGLTFERCDDARAFDHGIRHAVAELNEGTEGEETIFQVVDLPVGGRKNSSSQSASTTSTTTNSPSPTSPLPHHPFPSFPHHHHHHHHNHLHLVHYMPAAHKPRHATGGGDDGEKQQEEEGGYVYGHRTPSPHPSDHLDSWGGVGEEVWVRYEDYAAPKRHGPLLLQGGGGYFKDEPYVIFAKNKAGAPPPPHEYSYPSLEPGVHNPPAKRECTATRKQPLLCQPHPPLPTKTTAKGKGEQSRRLVAQCAQCRHCRDMFNVEDNQRGSCDSAPDAVRDCIECVTCVSCTKPLFYHCCADADGQYSHPCQCQASEDSHCRKWTALTLLSCFLPCLWCYPPLTACHRAAVSCGLCGGRRHKAA